MTRKILIATALAMIAAPASAATFTRTGAACPKLDDLITVYHTSDSNQVRVMMYQYGCKAFRAGDSVQVISNAGIVAVIVLPVPGSHKLMTRYYARSTDLRWTPQGASARPTQEDLDEQRALSERRSGS